MGGEKLLLLLPSSNGEEASQCHGKWATGGRSWFWARKEGLGGSASTRDSCGLPRALELSALHAHVTLPGYLDNDPEGFFSP